MFPLPNYYTQAQRTVSPWAERQAYGAYRGSFFARTLLSNVTPFRATYSASLSMTGWMSGGGGMIAAAEEEGWLTLA